MTPNQKQNLIDKKLWEICTENELIFELIFGDFTN